MRKHLFLVVILCGVLLLCGCGEKAETESGTKTAQPTFPLSPEVVEAALPGWEISQTLEHDVDGVVTYMLRPEGAETNLNGIVVNSYDLPETGRTLLIRKLESDPGWPDRTAEQTKAPEWADYKPLYAGGEAVRRVPGERCAVRRRQWYGDAAGRADPVARGGAGRRISQGDLLEPHDGGAAHLERCQHRVAAAVCVGVPVPAVRSLCGGGSGIAGGVTCAAP